MVISGDATWTEPTSGPLIGIRVVDFTQAAAGPFCAQHLGDMGATVLKIEPLAGDMIRELGDRPLQGMGTYFLGLNRNKRSITLNLQTPAGREIARQMCVAADVIVENHRPGVMERHCLDYETVSASNPRVVYASISAFGDSGPLRDKPGMDIVLQAFAGVMSITGPEEGGPVRVGVPVADLATGYAAAMGIVAALYERSHSGEGQRVTLSMLNVVMSLISNCATGFLLSGRAVERMGSSHPQLVPYQAFEGSDGEYIVIGILNERFWKKFCAMLGADQLATDPKFATNQERVQNRYELIALISARISERPISEWEQSCETFDVPYTRVNTFHDLFQHPQVEADAAVVTLEGPCGMGPIPVIAQSARFSRTPASYHSAPRQLGADTVVVLHEMGYTDSQIEDLVGQSVI